MGCVGGGKDAESVRPPSELRKRVGARGTTWTKRDDSGASHVLTVRAGPGRLSHMFGGGPRVDGPRRLRRQNVREGLRRKKWGEGGKRKGGL